MRTAALPEKNTDFNIFGFTIQLFARRNDFTDIGSRKAICTRRNE